MMLIEKVTDQKNNKQLTMTHEAQRTGGTIAHVLRFYAPNPAAGPLAGTLVASYVLTTEQALELKRSI